MISEPTKRHVTHQAKYVEAKMKARFDHPTTKRTEAMHVEARMKARFDCPTTKRTEAMHVEARMKAHFDCSTTLKTTRPTTTPPHPRTAPPTLSPAHSPSLRVCDDAPRASGGVHLNSSWIPSFNFFQKVKEKQLALAQRYLTPLPQLLSYYLLRHGHQLPKSDRHMTCHTYVIDQWAQMIHSESPLPPTPTFDTSLPVLPIPLPPPLSCVLEPVIPISTPVVAVSDLPKPSQPQVVDATLSTLSIMANLDTLQELFVSMNSRIDARLSKMETQMDDLTFYVIGSGSDTRAPIVAHETMPILQTSGDAATKIFTSTINIPDSTG
ncbi:hypothetical protein CK203_093860 [Vitis vinifera]|uniref:Uncharacterized protein n=1 Tax=Vitis vinifera TaxID=29760 RepID=A0A438C7P2_VITVI|nr:hypothetical protein CK203_093860 [Vitis vinifera]